MSKEAELDEELRRLRAWEDGSQSDGAGGLIANEEVRQFMDKCMFNRAKEIGEELRRRPGLAHATCQSGITALSRSSLYGAVETMRELLPLSDVNALSSGGWTALMRAAGAGRDESVRLLLASGADASLADKEGNTALFLAAGWGNDRCSRILLSRSDPRALGSLAGSPADAEAAARWRGAQDLADEIARVKAAWEEREALEREARGTRERGAPTFRI